MVDVPLSYRRLFAVPGFTRLVVGMLLARTAGQMVSLVLVLFVLQHYGSAILAGTATFLSIGPGLLATPIAGALLDRHGRARLIVVDYVVAAASLALLATLSFAGLLPAPLLLLIVTAASITGPLSAVGQRTLFPLIVPRPLWERANAIDSNGYVVSSIVAPAIAGTAVGAFGGELSLLATALVFAAAAAATVGLRDPETNVAYGSSLLRDALAGVVYVVHHVTLRGLAIVVSTANVANGLFYIAVPVLLLHELGQTPAVVGALFALSGVSGFFAVLFFGRVGTAGREGRLITASLAATVIALLIAALGHSVAAVAASFLLIGVATGPFDVAMFTLRQRRTEPAWLGRAFAVSMGLNFAGFPIGSALGGTIAAVSPTFALLVAVAITLLATVISPFLLRDEPEPVAAG